MTSLSVVIPFYNHWDLVHQTLYDLYQHCRNSLTEVVLVNDASTDETVYTGMQWWKERKMLPIKELRLKENHMFLKAANKGMKKATGEIFCLLSNDVRIYDDFCRKASDILSTYPNDEVGGRILNWDTGWNQFNGVVYPYIEGWLICCTGELWERLGGFDEQYAPSDFEDIDFSTKVLKAGGSLIELQPSDKLRHLGGQSIGFNPKREAITKTNREKFRKKWVESE